MSNNGIKRITVDVPEDFHKRIKHKALDEGKTVSDVVRQLLTAWLAETALREWLDEAPEK